MQHIHTYHRIDMGKKKPFWVMKCIGSHCNHYTPMKTKLSCPSLIGKEATCNKCGKEFKLDRRSLLQAYPSCESCIQSRPIQLSIKDSAEKFFEELEKGLIPSYENESEESEIEKEVNNGNNS